MTAQLALPFDTTVRAIAAHLHPFAESLELRDVTAGRTIFRSRALNLRGRIGLAKIRWPSSSCTSTTRNTAARPRAPEPMASLKGPGK